MRFPSPPPGLAAWLALAVLAFGSVAFAQVRPTEPPAMAEIASTALPRAYAAWRLSGCLLCEKPIPGAPGYISHRALDADREAARTFPVVAPFLAFFFAVVAVCDLTKFTRWVPLVVVAQVFGWLFILVYSVRALKRE